MFRTPFSFEGRIRRLEFGLSYIFFMILYVLMAFAWEAVKEYGLIFYLYFVLLYWFFMAQSSKRCHDLGNSGFFQFIPLYGLWLLFQEGSAAENKYGPNPKESISKEAGGIDKGAMGKTGYLNILIEISSPLLFNLLVMAFIIEYVNQELWHVFVYLGLTIIPCYFLTLVLNHKGNSSPHERNILFRQRLLYSGILYFCIRIYALVFKDIAVYVQAIYLELILIGIFMCLTFIPFYIYNSYVNKRLTNSYET
jgi:uncharacterized membrane protein YhaH (DUF805 family)